MVNIEDGRKGDKRDEQTNEPYKREALQGQMAIMSHELNMTNTILFT